MMKLKKDRPKTELEIVKEVCKAQGLDYDKIPLTAEYDVLGNILKIETDNVKLQNILKARGFKI